MFYGLIQPVVLYGLLVYGGALMHGSSTDRLQRKYDRIVFNLFSLRNETIQTIDSIYKRNSILKLADLYKCKCCVAIFKILNENYAPFLADAINGLQRHYQYNFRNRNNFYIPVPITKSVKMNFLYRAISLWNGLNNDLKNVPDSNQFEANLKLAYLECYMGS